MPAVGITVGVRDKNNSIIEAFFPQGIRAIRPDNAVGILAIMDDSGSIIAEFNERVWLYWEVIGASDDKN